MSKILKPEQLTLDISAKQLGFADTSELIAKDSKSAQHQAWIAQSEAKKSAEFGLNLRQPGFNLLALGEAGTGRTSLMLSAMHEAAAKLPAAQDIIALYQFDANGKPLFLKLPAGIGAQLKSALDQFLRQLTKELATLLEVKAKPDSSDQPDSSRYIETFLDQQLTNVNAVIAQLANKNVFENHFSLLKQDILDYLEAWQPASAESESNLEALLSESFLGRYRVNLLVDQTVNSNHAPVVYDNDPSLQSLFGGVESAGESSSTPDFLRLRAGNLLRSDGGTLLLHLRDILADEQNGAALLEKLHRFLRNATLQIEDLSNSSSQGGSYVSAQAVIPVSVKLVLIAARDDYYQLLEEKHDFFDYFPIKIEFAEKVIASVENYQAYAAFIAQKCQQFNCPHFTARAVAGLLQAMHRREEDQTRLSTQFASLEKLILESVAAAQMRNAALVDIVDVKAAIHHRYVRHSQQ